MEKLTVYGPDGNVVVQRTGTNIQSYETVDTKVFDTDYHKNPNKIPSKRSLVHVPLKNFVTVIDIE